MQFRACKAAKRLRQPFHACLRICTVCASATQSNSVGSCEEGNHTRMSVVLAPNAVTRPQMCAIKSQVMFSVLLHFFMSGLFNLAAVLNCEGYREGCQGNALLAWAVWETLMVVPVWWISNCTLESRRTLKQRRADQRATEIQNQRASGAFLSCKVNARRLLSVGRLRTAVGNGKPRSPKCARKSFCACATLTVLSSALSVQEVLLFLGTFSPKISSSKYATNGKGYTKISDFMASEK